MINVADIVMDVKLQATIRVFDGGISPGVWAPTGHEAMGAEK